MAIGRNPNTKYQAVYDELAGKIDSGQLTTGDRLPTGPELQESAGISHVTARKVYRLLQDQGYVFTTTQGTFVRCSQAERLLRRLCDTLNALEAAGQNLQLEVGRTGSCLMGREGGVSWNGETQQWERVES